MRIAYFIAGKTKPQITLQYLQSIGLGYAFDRKPMVQQLELGKGHEGKSGCVVSRDAMPVAGYHPGRQKIEPFVGADNVWILMDLQNPPTPEEMVRDDWKNSEFSPVESSLDELLIIDSHVLNCPNGQAWPIPIARAWSYVSGDALLGWEKTLPTSLRYVANKGDGRPGYKLGDVISKFLPLEKIAEEVMDVLLKGYVRENWLEVCHKIFRVPFYIGPQEMAMMELVNSLPATGVAVLELLIDSPGYHEANKKKAAFELTPTTSGDAD